MIRSKFLLAGFVLVFSFFSCKKSSEPEPKPCGSAISNTTALSGTSRFVFDPTDWNEGSILMTSNGAERSFSAMAELSGICPQELVNANYTVSTTNSPGNMVALEIKGIAEWGEGSKKEVLFCRKTDGNMKADHVYASYLEADLEPVFGTTSGSAKATVTISFHTLGSTALDTLYFRDKFKDLKVNISGAGVK